MAERSKLVLTLMSKCLRPNEEVLSFRIGQLIPSEIALALGWDPKYEFLLLTRARVLTNSVVGDWDPASASWGLMAWLQAEPKYREEFGYLAWLPRALVDMEDDQRTAYEVESSFVSAVQQIQSGSIATLDLTPERSTARRVHAPHSDTPLGNLAAAKGFPELTILCSTCGGRAGTVRPSSEVELFSECFGCERTIDGLQDGVFEQFFSENPAF